LLERELKVLQKNPQMRIIRLFLFFACFSALLQAQIINPGFESWTNANSIKQSTDWLGNSYTLDSGSFANSGLYAAKCGLGIVMRRGTW